MEGVFRRRRLPHWDIADATYFVTTCLAGSVPALGMLDIEEYRRVLAQRSRPIAMCQADWERHKHKLAFAKLDEWLDGKSEVRHFQEPNLASVVQQCIFHFAEVRYHVLAYVVMPSHLHWVFHPKLEWCQEVMHGAASMADRKSVPRRKMRTPREIVMHTLKSFTANECNRILKWSGTFWQDESYDHWVRDDDELLRIIEYIEQNPIKAGLVTSSEQYAFSSAPFRKLWGIAAGDPLIPH